MRKDDSLSLFLELYFYFDSFSSCMNSAEVVAMFSGGLIMVRHLAVLMYPLLRNSW